MSRQHLVEKLAPFAVEVDDEPMVSADVLTLLLTIDNGGQPLSKEAARAHVEGFARGDMVPLEQWVNAHGAPDSELMVAQQPIAGYLIASRAAPVDFGGPLPEETGDCGPPILSCSDNEDGPFHAPRLLPAQPASQLSEMREFSFRKRSPEKLLRAEALKARSSCLASHLITPAMRNRRLFDTTEGPQVACGSAPAARGGVGDYDGGAELSFRARGSPQTRKAKLSYLSDLAISGAAMESA